MAKLRTKGITLKIGETAVAGIKSLGGPGITVDTAEITELGDAYKKFLATIIDSGELSLGLFYDPEVATHAELWDLIEEQLDLDDDEQQEFVMTFPKGPVTFTFDACVTNFNIESMEPGGVVEASVTLKISGKIVIGLPESEPESP